MYTHIFYVCYVVHTCYFLNIYTFLGRYMKQFGRRGASLMLFMESSQSNPPYFYSLCPTQFLSVWVFFLSKTHVCVHIHVVYTLPSEIQIWNMKYIFLCILHYVCVHICLYVILCKYVLYVHMHIYIFLKNFIIYMTLKCPLVLILFFLRCLLRMHSPATVQYPHVRSCKCKPPCSFLTCRVCGEYCYIFLSWGDAPQKV